MEKQQIREELKKVNREIEELVINLSGLKSKRADLLGQLCDELQTILEKRSMDPYLVWNGKLSSGKVKFEELRIYFTNFRNIDKEEEVPEIKVAEVTKELPEEKSKVKKSKGKKKYIKFLVTKAASSPESFCSLSSKARRSRPSLFQRTASNSTFSSWLGV